MKISSRVIIFSIYSTLYHVQTAQCFDIGEFFRSWLMFGTSSSSNAINAFDCKVVDGRRKCKLDTKSLMSKLDVEDVIELFVDDSKDGRKIKCNKQLNKGNNKWYGSCDGDADDMNFIKRYDDKEDGSVAEGIYGSIHVGDHICRIYPTDNADGKDEIDCVPKSSFKSEDPPKVTTGRKMRHERRRQLQNMYGFVPSYTGSISNVTTPILRSSVSNQTERRRLFDDSGSTIDVMVVWTRKAECNNYGLNSGCTVNAATESRMRGLIDLAIEETNTAFELSGIFTQLRLVHAYRDPNYSERGRGDFYSYLEHLTYDDDGHMDSIHENRALYGADVVQMIVSDDNSCGIAWNDVPSIDWMFSVAHYDCATGYYSFGHEIGHNFNLLHDRSTEGSCNARGSTNYGYRDPNSLFRTILSYDCERGGCDNLPRDGCDRIQRFSNSNPQYRYNGRIIGNAQNDNARQFNRERARVASFYPAMDCQSDSECNDRNSRTVDSCDRAKRVCVFSPAGSVPVRPPVAAPVRVTTRSPVKSPTGAPAKSPIRAPVREPVVSPTEAEVPVGENQLPVSFLESLKVTGVTSVLWKPVTLTKTFVSPIPICTIMEDGGFRARPAVVRMTNVGSTSFEIRLQNPSDRAIGAKDVHCVVVEEGAWKFPDGRLLEAKKYSSTVTDGKASWRGETQTYENTYRNPVVLGQVMSFNDPKWSVFWSRASSAYQDAPTSTSLVTGKHVGEDNRTTRAAETVGYIVMEAGHARSGSIEFEAGLTGDSFGSFRGFQQRHPFQERFSSAPVVAVLSQGGMDGTDGSWAFLTSNPTSTDLNIAVAEDHVADSEGLHTPEEVFYAVFSLSGTIQLVIA